MTAANNQHWQPICQLERCRPILRPADMPLTWQTTAPPNTVKPSITVMSGHIAQPHHRPSASHDNMCRKQDKQSLESSLSPLWQPRSQLTKTAPAPARPPMHLGPGASCDADDQAISTSLASGERSRGVVVPCLLVLSVPSLQGYYGLKAETYQGTPVRIKNNRVAR